MTDDLITGVAKKATVAAEPDDDLHASKEYRINLAQVMTKRAINQAYRRAVQRGETQ